MSEVKSGGSGLPDNIDLHPAGYELDCLLAERVLGALLLRGDRRSVARFVRRTENRQQRGREAPLLFVVSRTPTLIA